MSTDMPRPFTGVYQRPGSNNYHWCIKVPADLKAAYPGQTWAERLSLRTSDLRDANLKAAALYAGWQQRFSDKRKMLNRSKVDSITPEMAEMLARTLRHDALAEDEQNRLDPHEHALLQQWMKGMDMPGADQPTERFGGMPDAVADLVATTHAEHSARLGAALSRGNLKTAWPALLRTASKLGLAFDENTPGLEHALRLALKTMREVAALKVSRDAGEVVDTPSPPSTSLLHEQSKEKPKRLRDVFERLKKGKTRKADSLAKYELALKLYEQQTGNPPIADVRREHGDAFRAWLQEQGTAGKTAHDRLTCVKSLFGYAAQDLEWLPKNPWRGLDIEYITENKRSPWTDPQLDAMFGLPLFTDYALPQRNWKAGGDAAYWIPVIAIFTGARIGELCQLRVSDIYTERGYHFIRITDEAIGSTVKTAAGIRDVPMHSELVRLGLLEYTEAVRKTGTTSLWPALKVRDGKPGGYFSAFFSDLRKTCPVEVPDFHSLRHLVRTQMTEAEVSEPIQDRVTGHAVQGSEGTRTYTHPQAVLRRAIEAIQYPALALPRVYQGQEPAKPSTARRGRPASRNLQ